MSVQTLGKWERVAIREVADIVAGGTPPSKDVTCFALPGSAIAWLTPADLSGYKNQTIKYGSRDLTVKGLASCSAKLMPAGAVLFSSRAPIGYVAIAGGPISTNQGFKSFVFAEPINNRFAYYQLRHLVPEAEARATGTTFKELSGSAAAKLPFLVAPVVEQRRIAEKLDTILTRVDALNDRLARITPLLKRFRQSVLAAAIAGRLTEDWRAPYQCKYIQTSLKAVCEKSRVITYGVVKLGAETQDGVPCLRTSNVRWLRFDLDGTKLIDPGLSAEYARTVLQGGEVLVNVRGTLGGVAAAQPSMVGWNVSREVAVVPVDKDIAVSAFIALWIASDECQRWLTGVTKGVAYAGINIEDLRALPVNLPMVAEQTEIVRRVEILFAYANRLEARLQTARTAADRLTPALLAKAFRGELVPQDPNDEPATELLRRLREARAAEVPAKKARGRKAQVA